MNYIQAFYNLPLAIVNSEDKQDYIQALIHTKEKEDIAIFREFMKQQYMGYLSQKIEKYQREINQNDNNILF